MRLEELREKVRKWDRQLEDQAIATSHYESLLHRLEYHATREWRVYLPTEHTDFNPSYLERLAAWIGNVSDEADQKLLLEYASCISFFSHEDFAALYRTALNRAVIPWVADQSKINLNKGSADFQSKLQEEMHGKTWFCPVTDSMDINEFYKVNHLTDIGHRPGFATLQMLAEKVGEPCPEIANNLIAYMKNPSLKPVFSPPFQLERLILLEDIVGSGSQSIEAVKWAVTNLNVPVLFVPLILCPNGSKRLEVVANGLNGSLTVHPVIELCRCDLLGPERHEEQGWQVNKDAIEELVMRCAPRASHEINPFGYKSTGCSIVTFSNSPDNSLPIIHNKPRNGNWEPLFPRVYRD